VGAWIHLAVKWASPGGLIRSRTGCWIGQGQVLNYKNSSSSLIDPQAGVKLVVPSMERRQRRQSARRMAGKSYWMVFSNKPAGEAVATT